jgi:hypothetical protein
LTDDGVPYVSDGQPQQGRLIPRRVFLGGVASASAFAAVQPTRFWQAAAAHRAALASSVIPDSVNLPPPDLAIAVERDTDLVLLDFAFYGFTVVPASPGASTPPTIKPTTLSNVIVVQFPPQALGEGVYFWEANGVVLPVDPPPILSDLSGPSRLCFTLAGGQGIPLPTMTVADLLDWTGWSMTVPAAAQFTGLDHGHPPVPPGMHETSIEFPYGLFLAPVVDAPSLPPSVTTAFVSPTQPLVSSQGVVDLWSTTLTSVVVATGESITPNAAAVWAVDYQAAGTTVADYTPETNINYFEPTT